jgi:hypothetical protein
MNHRAPNECVVLNKDDPVLFTMDKMRSLAETKQNVSVSYTSESSRTKRMCGASGTINGKWKYKLRRRLSLRCMHLLFSIPLPATAGAKNAFFNYSGSSMASLQNARRVAAAICTSTCR